MIYVPIPTGLFFLSLIIISPALCVVATILSERFYTRHLRKDMAAREAVSADVERSQDVWADRLAVREMGLDDREEELITREQEFRRKMKEAEAALTVQAALVDTEVSVLFPDDLPQPPSQAQLEMENDATISMPPVQE